MTTINFEAETCSECGIIFQVPEDFYEDRQEDGQSFWCPNGHEQSYVDCADDQIEKLQEENENLRREIRKLKCVVIGRLGVRDRVKMWWKGGKALLDR